MFRMQVNVGNENQWEGDTISVEKEFGEDLILETEKGNNPQNCDILIGTRVLDTRTFEEDIFLVKKLLVGIID